MDSAMPGHPTAEASDAPPTRPRLPTRSNSTRSYHDDPAPYDAARSDDKAITDVYKSVEETGSLEAAAKKLHQIAVARAWEDDPEEAAYLAQTRQAYEDEEMENPQVYEDEDGYTYGYGQNAEEVVHLQEIVPGLWVGDLVAAMDTEGLKERGIANILSLLRPSLEFPDAFAVYPLEIDDHSDTDILSHLPSCVAWIHEALDKRQQPESAASAPIPGEEEIKALNDGVVPSAPRDKLIDPAAAPAKAGAVFVHCQAGMSRSATVVAAYLMRVLEIGPVEAVELIQEKRPVVSPSETFWYQLGLFYNADGRVSLRDRSTRQYYMERTTNQFMNGDGGAPAMERMAKYPATPTLSRPATPLGTRGRRKIRCKACRRHLAVREHMMDHILNQAPVSRPRTPSESQPPSRTSFSHGSGFTSVDPVKEEPTGGSRRPSVISDVVNPLTGKPGATKSRQGSLNLNMTSANPSPVHGGGRDSPVVHSPGSLPYPKTNPPGAGPSSLDQVTPPSIPEAQEPGLAPALNNAQSGKVFPNSDPYSPRPLLSADELSSRLPPHLQALRTRKISMSQLTSPFNASPASSPEKDSPIRHGPIGKQAQQSNTASAPISPATSSPASATPASQAVTLGRSKSQGGGPRQPEPRTQPRRMSVLAMTPTEGPSRRPSLTARRPSGVPAMSGPPILVNPKCSGYFVEPLTWMEPILKGGNVSGKIVCPNEKCGVKLGNFDWAGVQCGCKEWVTPGFCIHRSKVDEVF